MQHTLHNAPLLFGQQPRPICQKQDLAIAVKSIFFKLVAKHLVTVKGFILKVTNLLHFDLILVPYLDQSDTDVVCLDKSVRTDETWNGNRLALLHEPPPQPRGGGVR